MGDYYFVGTMLPTLSFEGKPEITFAEFSSLLSANLSEKDLDKTIAIRRFYDVLNLRALWLGEEFNPNGLLTPLELEEALVAREGLPSYVYDFIEAYTKKEDRMHYFPLLFAQLHQEGTKTKDPFLVAYLAFERGLRLVMTAFRAKKLKRDIAVELQYEDPEEDLIAQILAQENAQTYEPPEKYHELKELFDRYGNDPLSLQKEIDAYRFQKVEELVDPADTFSIERILAYLIQLMIVEKWNELDKIKGMQIVDTLLFTGTSS